MRRTCDVSMGFLDSSVICVGNPYRGKECACSREQNLTTMLNVLETCVQQHRVVTTTDTTTIIKNRRYIL